MSTDDGGRETGEQAQEWQGMKSVVCALLLGLGIAVAGLSNRFEIVAFPGDGLAGGLLWKVDGLTGAVTVCDRTGCMQID